MKWLDWKNDVIISGIRITILEDLGVTRQLATALGNTATFKNARKTQVNKSKRIHATKAAISMKDRRMWRKVEGNVQIGKVRNTIIAEHTTKNDQERSFKTQFLPKNRIKASTGPFCIVEYDDFNWRHGGTVRKRERESCSVLPEPELQRDSIECPIGCLSDEIGSEYKGKAYMTAEGYVCQRWDVNYPNYIDHSPDADDRSHNFCRNPNNDPRGPWVEFIYFS